MSEVSYSSTGMADSVSAEPQSNDAASQTPRCPFLHMQLNLGSFSPHAKVNSTWHDASEAETDGSSPVGGGQGLPEADKNCAEARPNSREMNGVESKSKSGAKPRRVRRRPLKRDGLPMRRLRSRAQVDSGTATDPTPVVNDASVQTTQSMQANYSCVQPPPDRSTGEMDSAAEAVPDLGDRTLDNVRLTDKELETCRRLDSLARDRQQSRAAAVNECSLPAEAMIELLDIEGEPVHLVESSADQAGQLTYRRGSPSPDKENSTGESISVSDAVGHESADSSPTKLDTPPRSNSSPSNPGTVGKSKHRLQSVLEPMQAFLRRRIQPQCSDRRSIWRADESEPAAKAAAAAANESSQRQASLKQDASSVTRETLASNRSSCSSYYDSFSHTSLATTASVMETPRDRIGTEIRNTTDRPLNATMNSASYAESPDERSARSDVSADATSDRRRRVCVKEVPMRSKGDCPLDDSPAENQMEVRAMASDVLEGRQKMSRRCQGHSTWWKPFRPIRSTTIVIERHFHADAMSLPSSVNAHTYRLSRRISTPSSSPASGHARSTHHQSGAKPSGTSRYRSNPAAPHAPLTPHRSGAKSFGIPRPSSNLASLHARSTTRLSGAKPSGTPRPSSNTVFLRALSTTRLSSAKLSSTPGAATPGSSRSTASGRASRPFRYPSPTKASELRLRLRAAESHSSPQSGEHRPAVIRDRIGAKLFAGVTRWNCSTLKEDGYAKLEKARSIPVEFRLKEICRDVDKSDVTKDSESDTPRVPAKTREDHGSRAARDGLVICNGTSVTTERRQFSPDPGDSGAASAITDSASVVRCSGDLGVTSLAITTADNTPRLRLKRQERFQVFVGIDPSDVAIRSHRDKTVSDLEEKGQSSSLQFRYYGVTENFYRSPTRTFLVPKTTGTTPVQRRRPLTPIRRDQPQAVQNTKRTFLVGQSCVKKTQTRCPRDPGTAGLRPRRQRSYLDTLQRTRSLDPNREHPGRYFKIPDKPDSPPDEHSSSKRFNPHSTPKTSARNLVTNVQSSHSSVGPSNGLPPIRGTQVRSQTSHSSSPAQPQQLCSTPILGSNRPRTPLVYSPIPFIQPAKRPTSYLAMARNRKMNISYTISSSPNTSSSSSPKQPRRRDSCPLDSINPPSKKKTDRDGSRKATMADGISVDPATLANHGASSSCSVRQNVTPNTAAPPGDGHHRNSEAALRPSYEEEEEEEGLTETEQPSTVASRTISSPSPPPLKYITYRNHSHPVDATLSTGKQSKIPQACWYPYHIISAETDVSRFRFRIHYHEIPPRSFRYSRSHRKIVEDRMPDCIRQLPKLILEKSRVRNREKKPMKV